jgi:hypothetical protein
MVDMKPSHVLVEKMSLGIISGGRYVGGVSKNGEEGRNMIVAFAIVCVSLLAGLAVSEAHLA